MNVVTIAEGPIVHEPGVSHRVVLRSWSIDKGPPTGRIVEYAVHTLIVDPARKPSYNGGNYYPVRDHGGNGTGTVTAFAAAFKRWQERTAESVAGIDFASLTPRKPADESFDAAGNALPHGRCESAGHICG